MTNLDSNLAGHYAGQIEELLDQPHLDGDISIDDFDPVSDLIRNQCLRFKKFDPAEDSVERRAEFVRQYSEKLILGAIELFRAFPGRSFACHDLLPLSLEGFRTGNVPRKA